MEFVLQTIWPTGQTMVTYQWLQAAELDQWWQWILVALICTAVLAFVIYWYRRDSVELTKQTGWALALLRLTAFVGLLLFFLQLDKRTEQRIVRNSRVAVLVDTSLSMTLAGTPSPSGVPNDTSRIQEITNLFNQSSLLEQLANDHELSVYNFDQAPRPGQLAAFTKKGAVSEELASESATADDGSLAIARQWLLAAIVGACIAALLFAVAFAGQIAGKRQWIVGGWLLLIGAVLAIVSVVVGGFAVVPETRYPMSAFLGTENINLLPQSATTDDGEEEDGSTDAPEDWTDLLAARGTQSRIGDAIKFVLDREAGAPLAGIILLTDGRNNAGIAPREVLALAQNSRVPFYVVGLGSPDSPPNVEVVEVDAPKRLYPGDPFALSGILGSSGFAGKQVTVQVLAGDVDADIAQLAIEDEKIVELPEDGSITPASFKLEPKSVGQWQYAVKIIPLQGDANRDDNIKTTQVEVIERKNRVLIIAGGPTREYQFVRNLLFRDRDVESHVMLQSGNDGSSQEAQELIFDFPADRQALSRYDAVLAFDADWTQIPESAVAGLEQWVAEQAGGFLLVAGSVEMPKWLARSASAVTSSNLRGLSPVVLERRGSALLASGRVESESAWPLTVTNDGRQTDFLWITDEAESSFELWDNFGGVHSFYSAYELKPGAKSLLTFSDPTAALDGQPPIYLATQFYGAGRSAYLGGGELWRIREEGDYYFDRLYTKLVRWISQGRLLLDSDRGVLLVDREKAVLGEQVMLRAVLKNERYEPLLQSEVVVRLTDPVQNNVPITLRPLPDGSQPGVYSGQFSVLVPGDYTAQLQLDGIGSDEVLTASVRATVPALEMQNAERNDKLLQTLAVDSGGKYWPGIDLALQNNESGRPELLAAITAQDQVAYLPGTPDREFQLRWLGWLMTLIAVSLTLEWFTRRLHRLA